MLVLSSVTVVILGRQVIRRVGSGEMSAVHPGGQRDRVQRTERGSGNHSNRWSPWQPVITMATTDN